MHFKCLINSIGCLNPSLIRNTATYLNMVFSTVIKIKKKKHLGISKLALSLPQCCSLHFFPPVVIDLALCISPWLCMCDGSIRSRLSVCGLEVSRNSSLTMKREGETEYSVGINRVSFLSLLGNNHVKTPSV